MILAAEPGERPEDVAFTARLRVGLAFVEVTLLANFVVGEGAAVRVR